MAAVAPLIARDWAPAHVEALLPSVGASPWGPLEGPGDVLIGSHLYEFNDGGRRALIAARPVKLQHGTRLDIVGLVSLGDRLPGAEICSAIDELATQHQAQQLAMCTRRAHVVRAAARANWQITGMVMTKDFR